MSAAAGQGISNTLSDDTVDQTVEKLKGILKAKGIVLFALRGEESRNENASHQAADLWKPRGGYTLDAGRSHYRH